MDKKSLVGRQVFIVLYLLAAAVSCIEAAAQFKIGGFTNWRFYFFAGIFIFSCVMYFIRKKQRLEDINKPKV